MDDRDLLAATQEVLEELLEWAQSADMQIDSEWGRGDYTEEPLFAKVRAVLDGRTRPFDSVTVQIASYDSVGNVARGRVWVGERTVWEYEDDYAESLAALAEPKVTVGHHAFVGGTFHVTAIAATKREATKAVASEVSRQMERRWVWNMQGGRWADEPAVTRA